MALQELSLYRRETNILLKYNSLAINVRGKYNFNKIKMF